MIHNDAVLFGILAVMLGAVFYTHALPSRFWKRFYIFFPALLLCYFLPSLLNSFGLVNAEESRLYFVASRYLLPASLVLLTMATDFKKVLQLGPKALAMFLTGTVGIVIGGPAAIWIMSLLAPEVVAGHGPDAVWRGMTTIAGSWIGGGANQAAMKEVFSVGDHVFSMMVTVDIIVANIWMAVLLVLAARAKKIDDKIGADTSAIEALRESVEKFQAEHARIPSLTDLMLIAAVAFGVVGLAHALADITAGFFANRPGMENSTMASQFFWLVVFSTTGGLILSMTRAHHLEAAGASKVGSAFIYVLVATIGLKMDITAIMDNPGIFLVGLIWMSIHALLLLTMAWLLKAPVFFMAVGSQANVGGAASAPVVASAFHPSLAPVGALLAVLGYALGTYGAWLTGMLMQWVAPAG
ncbi:MAG: DUF819 family protein [Gammaproteobacteria bacterium]|nr:MAG: DUF819 family protein [Gammaproteobacteria bacterium]